MPSIRSLGAVREQVIAAALILWIALEFVCLGPYSSVYIGDNLTALIPGLLAGMADGNLSDWNRFAAMGWDRVATDPLGIGYYILFLLLPTWLAYQIACVLQIVGAFVGVFGLMRRRLGCSSLASLFAAFLFASHGQGQLQYVSLHLTPLLILAIGGALDNTDQIWRWINLAAIVLVIASTAWISELVPFIVVPIVIWFIFLEPRRAIRDWLIILAAAVLPIALRASDLSTIGSYTTLGHKSLLVLPPSYADLLSVPDFLRQPRSLILAALFISALLPPREPLARRALAAFVVCVGGLYMAVPIRVLLSELVPWTAGYSLVRLEHTPTLLLVVGSGLGIDVLRRHSRALPFPRMARAALVASIGMGFLLSILTKAEAAYAWITQGNFRANFESPVLADLAKRLQGEHDLLRVESWQTYPAYLHAYGMETAGGLPALTSRRQLEFWSEIVDPSFLEDNAFGESVAAQLTPDWPRFRGNMLMLTNGAHRAEWTVAEQFRMNLLSLANVAYIVSRNRLVDPALELIISPPRAWSEYSVREKIALAFDENFSGRRTYFVYRNRDVLPRFFAAHSIAMAPTARGVLAQMAKMTPADLSQTVLVAEGSLPDGIDPKQKYARANVRVVAYAADRISLEIERREPTEDPILLVASNAFSPYWSGAADSRPITIFPADHALWGVVLPADTRQVTFEYRRP